MCFLYELHEYIELLKEKYNLDEKVADDIDNIENNIVDIYYNNKIYNINEQINTILSQLTIEAGETNEADETNEAGETNETGKASGTSSNKIFKEMKENIIDIYGINKKKRKEYYSYICDIKNITIE
jgi:hypothetical protein